MTDAKIFDLQSTHNPHRFVLPVEEGMCVGPPGGMFLFGGMGLASSVMALERALDRPAVWATAQYLSYAQPGSVLDLDVIAPKAGRNITQARLVGKAGEREIFTANAALGSRDMDLEQQWVQAPDAPKPEDCPDLAELRGMRAGLHSRLETRVARGRWGWQQDDNQPATDGSSLLWVRSREGWPVNAALLAVVADYVPGGSAPALGRRAGANSLDITLRLINPDHPTEWILCDLLVYATRSGFIHGRAHLFAEDGTLMATSSQSGILRIWDGETPPIRSSLKAGGKDQAD